jgi:hypothetical protein
VNKISTYLLLLLELSRLLLSGLLLALALLQESLWDENLVDSWDGSMPVSLKSRIQCMEKSAEWELQLKRDILADG